MCPSLAHSSSCARMDSVHALVRTIGTRRESGRRSKGCVGVAVFVSSARHDGDGAEAAGAGEPAVKLGYFPYSTEDARASEEQQVCAICLEVLAHGAMCSQVPACRRLFHRYCIDLWTKNRATCPLCRAKIVTTLRRSYTVANAMA
jgi:hypothetical protein